MINYPTSLKEALLAYGVAPTWNVEWDKGVLALMKANKKEEADKMKGDEIWLDAVCMQNHIDREEILRRIEAFPIHCEAECSDKPHKDYADAKKHFCSWMRKAYSSYTPNEPEDMPPPPLDYSFNGGFKSMDS